MTRVPLTVAGLLRTESRPGGKALLICDGEHLSYDEAARRSSSLAGRLVALGVGKGTHVGLLYPNGVQFVVAMLAAARIGAVVVPFSTSAPHRSWAGNCSTAMSACSSRLGPIGPTTTSRP